MDREILELETPNKHKIKYKAYATGRERREIQNVFLEGMEIDVSKGTPNKMKANLANKAQDKTIQMMIVSVDDKEDDILNKILDLPAKDFDAIISALNALETDKKKLNK